MSKLENTRLELPQTGIEDIDKQYQKIESIINNLKKGLESDCVSSNIPTVFYGLMHLYSHYFIQEQITLAKYNYKDLYSLKAFHKEFLDDILLFREKIAKSPNLFCNEMIPFLITWSKDYFLINQKAINFLKEKGVK